MGAVGEKDDMEKLIFSKDKYDMNWLREDFTYGEVIAPKELTAVVNHTRKGDKLHTQIILKNISGKTFFTKLTDIGIRFPLEDKYESSQICMKKRCHTHIFCGGNISYMCALRMGGEAPHLGMVLMQGSLSGYSVERDIAKMSNDRGCFLLHPSPMELLPEESYILEWTVFPHEGWEDFYEKMESMRKFVKVSASSYAIFPGESCTLKIQPSFVAKSVIVDGVELTDRFHGALLAENQEESRRDNACGQFDSEKAEKIEGMTEEKKQEYTVIYTADSHDSHVVSGVFYNDNREKVFHINVDGIKTTCRILIQEDVEKLAKKRCHFIAEKQQYEGRDEHLRGAYLVYDNEEKHQFYNCDNDYNGGRERVGMSLAIISYLQTHVDEKLMESLDKHTEFVLRELVDIHTGEVFNDYKRNNSYLRWYNAPWFAEYFVELYRLKKNEEYLTYACRIVRCFYEDDGVNHYAIEMPVVSLIRELGNVGMELEQEKMKALFCAHANRIMEIGYDYPASEVNYEQSIVAPAANILLQVYLITEEEKYLEAGKKQMDVLELFNGRQPDYHLYETAVRHWDGYWFGKRKLYGDTFPHYWSALTGICYELYAQATGDREYHKKAEDSLRSVLSLIHPDGTGSCAYVFPKTVNGTLAELYDPYSNDQDWGLYFYLRNKQVSNVNNIRSNGIHLL